MSLFSFFKFQTCIQTNKNTKVGKKQTRFTFTILSMKRNNENEGLKKKGIKLKHETNKKEKMK